MISLFTFQSPPGSCGYLPAQTWSLEYEVVGQLSVAEYAERLEQGWRRFGYSLFRPACPTCRACRPIRVPVESFKPNRSQRRAWKANHADVRITIGEPGASREKLDLYDKFHRAQAERVGWPGHDFEETREYVESFVENPFPSQEWTYRMGDRLVGVGYVDRLPAALSAIYFYHDPDERNRSLGTFNVLAILEAARLWQLPHVYLGFYVAGCRSLEYKGLFQPNEARDGDGDWRPFLV